MLLAEMFFPASPVQGGAHLLQLCDISFFHFFNLGVFLQHVPGSFLGASDLLLVSPSLGFGDAVLSYGFCAYKSLLYCSESGSCDRHQQE